MFLEKRETQTTKTLKLNKNGLTQVVTKPANMFKDLETSF